MRSVWTLVIGTALISTSFIATGCASSSRVVRRTRTTPMQARMAERNGRRIRPATRVARRAPTQPSYVSRPAPMANYAPAPRYAPESYGSDTYLSDAYAENSTYVDNNTFAMPASYVQSDAYAGDAYLPADTYVPSETYVSPSTAVASYASAYQSGGAYNNGTPGLSADGTPTATIVDPTTNRSVEILDPCGIAGSNDQWVDVSSRGGPATCTTGNCSSGSCGLPNPFSGSGSENDGGCANGKCDLPK